MTDEDLARFVEAQMWRFARTMPQWPHWYCLRDKCDDQAAFFAFVRHIQCNGYEAEFRPEQRDAWARRRYLDLGDYHYWTMDETVEGTTLINRALHPNVAIRC
jgi:hypothetical protein